MSLENQSVLGGDGNFFIFDGSANKVANASSASVSSLTVSDGLNFALFDLGTARDNGMFQAPKAKWDHPGCQHRRSNFQLCFWEVCYCASHESEAGPAHQVCHLVGSWRYPSSTSITHSRIASFGNVCCSSATRRIQIANFAAVQPSLLTVHLGESMTWIIHAMGRLAEW